MRQEPVIPPNAWNNGGHLLAFWRQTFAVAEADVRKLIHDPVELLTRMTQPALWLLVFGQVFAHAQIITTGGLSYLDFIAPGILAQSVLFSAIFYGISVIWERDLGILQKFLVSPASRPALVLGRALSAGVRGLSQALIVYVLAFILGVHLHPELGSTTIVLMAVIMGSAIFSTFSLIAACIVKTRERFMGVGQVLTMPLFFTSNAIYPLSMMPPWLRIISKMNPLTYQIDAIRSNMIEGGQSIFGSGVDFAVMLAILALLIAIATRLYPNIIN
ncbi:MAG: ABC transporter permease [Thermodesulfovibrionales bacterium]|jgi:ABC-2 type transport system permease protein